MRESNLVHAEGVRGETHVEGHGGTNLKPASVSSLPAEAPDTVEQKQVLLVASLNLYVSPQSGCLRPLHFREICYSVTVTGTSWVFRARKTCF